MASVDVKVLGARRLSRIARAARAAHDRDAGRALRRAMTAGAKPMQKAVKESVPEYMPRSGGYARTLKRALRLSTKVRSSARTASVQIKARAVGRKKFRDVRALEGGRLRHPVFGNMSRWVLQAIRPHFFTEPLREQADEVRSGLVDAMDQVAENIANS